jgi:tRNA threonylcarbamoyladenosine biosynthesis protein TsaB
MLALAIDTSQRRGSAALARDGEVLSETAFGEERSHLRDLGVAVDGMLSAHGLAVNDVDRVALVSGPGSFTGVRIGMAFVKGLHAGLGIEVVTMGTLALLALPLFETHDSVCTMLDAHKGEVYAAVFARNVGDRVPMATADVVVPPCAMTAERFLERLRSTPAVFTGSGVARYRAVIEPAVGAASLADPVDVPPSAAHLARIAHRLEPHTKERIRSLEPDYVRASEAELKRLKDGPR